jgi:hypothetical protein
MKVLLFMVSEKQDRATLEYRSGGDLTVKELEILKDYIDDLIALEKSMQPLCLKETEK